MTHRLLKPVVPATLSTLIVLSACGGSSSGISVNEGTDNGNQNLQETANTSAALPQPITSEETPTAPTSQATISGRVADGYLRGATVCIDLNENESCDESEPQTISEAGGVYSLSVPDEHSDKPIVAEVPAEAIDEDTGQPFGRDVIFSTPADRPGFISPLTTLVHQELKDNPALSVDDAEAALGEALGLDAADDTGLFKDYVELAETGEEDSRKKYQYLHQTARVVAGMMGDIRETVKDSVTESGVDLEGDKEARQALQQMVRTEVRELIPEIAEAVANRIQEIDTADGTEPGASDADLIVEFNPDELVQSLRPEDVANNAPERLEAIKEERTATTVAMKDLFAQGIYTLDIDCDYVDFDYYYEQNGAENTITDGFTTEDSLTQPVESGVSVMLNDDGEIEFEALPRHCSAYYSTFHVAPDTTEIEVEFYYYNTTTSQWTEEIVEDIDASEVLALIEGEWTAVTDNGLEAVLEYTEDGGAVLSTDAGNLHVSASVKQLDDTSAAQHIRNRGAEPQFYKLIDQNAQFPADSWVYNLLIKRRAAQHILFKWEAEDYDTNCTRYSDNCNLIDVKDDLGFVPVTTIAELQEASTSEVTINEIFYDHFDGQPVDLVLTAEPTSDGNMPVTGVARWITARQAHYTDYRVDYQETPYPNDSNGIIEHNCLVLQPKQVQNDATTVDNTIHTSDGYNGTDCPDRTEFPETELLDNLRQPLPDGSAIGALDDHAGLPDTDDNGIPVITEAGDESLGESKWHVIEVEGQTMIEIELPVIVRHRFDQMEVATFLLAEQGGYVRRGIKQGDVNIDHETGYSLAAFETLLPLVEQYIEE